MTWQRRIKGKVKEVDYALGTNDWIYRKIGTGGFQEYIQLDSLIEMCKDYEVEMPAIWDDTACGNAIQTLYHNHDQFQEDEDKAYKKEHFRKMMDKAWDVYNTAESIRIQVRTICEDYQSDEEPNNAYKEDAIGDTEYLIRIATQLKEQLEELANL